MSKHDLKIVASMEHYYSEAWKIRKDGTRCREKIVTTALCDNLGKLNIKDITRNSVQIITTGDGRIMPYYDHEPSRIFVLTGRVFQIHA